MKMKILEMMMLHANTEHNYSMSTELALVDTVLDENHRLREEVA